MELTPRQQEIVDAPGNFLLLACPRVRQDACCRTSRGAAD